MTLLLVGLVLLAGSASAQTFAPGAVQAPVLGRHFLDQPVATCVIAVPVSPTAVMLTPCPVGTQPGQLPASAPPAVSVTPPMVTPPVAEPKAPEAKEPIVIRIEVVPVAPPKAAPMPAPKAVPKKGCPC